MSTQQRVAIFQLAVTVAAALAYLALWPIIGAFRATGAFGLLGLIGFSAFFYWKGKRTGRVIADERDQMIGLRAFALAQGVIWFSLLAAFIAMVWIVGDEGTIPMRGLTVLCWWSFCVMLMVQSAATLVLYARR